MRLQAHGTNCHELITTWGTAALFSYGQLVAVNIQGSLYQTDVKYSRTAAKHILLAGYGNAAVVSQDRLIELSREV